jgi:glycosyltransferase involved in cell wall biosynthesis
MFRMNLIKQLQERGFKVIAIAPYDEYSNKLQEQGVEYIPISINNKGTSPKDDLKLIYNLYTIYKIFSPDCILHFTIKPNIYGSIAAQLLRIPVINNITGLGTVFLKDSIIQTITKSLYKFAFKKVDKVFFQNDDDKKFFMVNNLVDKNKADVLPGSGVDTKKFAPRKDTNKTTEMVFLLIARVIRDKGIIEYVNAAKSIKEKYVGVEFQLLGQLGTINKSAIGQDEVEDWQKENIINYLGTAEDVRDTIANADCIVLPSYREGTSKTLLEAASMGKPIITTDVPGCNNVVNDGENGYLCRVKDTIDLADKIEMMINLSSDEREIMGSNGRAKMVNEFEEEIVIQKYLDAIKIIFEEK